MINKIAESNPFHTILFTSFSEICEQSNFIFNSLNNTNSFIRTGIKEPPLGRNPVETQRKEREISDSKKI